MITAAAKAVAKLSSSAASTRGAEMMAQNSPQLSWAAWTNMAPRGISTNRLRYTRV
ncbi:hypothetical protein D3C85_1525720 [compost metagenome]